MKFLKELLIACLVLILFLGTFTLAYLQESYRLNPPSMEEVNEMPLVVRWLYE